MVITNHQSNLSDKFVNKIKMCGEKNKWDVLIAKRCMIIAVWNFLFIFCLFNLYNEPKSVNKTNLCSESSAKRARESHKNGEIPGPWKTATSTNQAKRWRHQHPLNQSNSHSSTSPSSFPLIWIESSEIGPKPKWIPIPTHHTLYVSESESITMVTFTFPNCCVYVHVMLK